MTKTLYYLIIGLLISCTQQNKNAETVVNIDTLKVDSITEIKIDDSTSASEDEDCIFNNDYKQLTTEWLTELKINNFIWRADLDQALVPNGQDTIFLSKGGCYHFGMSVELKLTNDSHSLKDSALWMNRALKLAIEYKMDHYKQMLEEGRVRMAQDGDKRVTYLVEDEKEPGNLVYDGIEFTQEGKTNG